MATSRGDAAAETWKFSLDRRTARYLASIRRLKPDDEEAMVDALSHLGCCLDDLGRHDEALVLKREVHARRVEF